MLLVYSMKHSHIDKILTKYFGGQPPERLLCKKRCSQKSMLESLFNKIAGLKVCNFIKKRLQNRCFPVKFVKF